METGGGVAKRTGVDAASGSGGGAAEDRRVHVKAFGQLRNDVPHAALAAVAEGRLALEWNRQGGGTRPATVEPGETAKGRIALPAVWTALSERRVA